MRSVLVAGMILATAAAAIQTVPTSGPRHVRLGKTTERVNRKLMLQTKYGKGTNISIGGNIWPVSIYWTYVSAGTPLKPYAVAIDSGSFAMYLSGQGCKGCVTKAPNTQYNPNASSTSVDLHLPFGASYETCDPTHPLQPCSISGGLYNDMASLAGYGPTTVQMGAIMKQTSNFYQFQTIDGIMGMVGNVTGNVFNELCVQNSFCSPVWAICMHEGKHSNGTMTIGGIDESLASGPIQYVPRDENPMLQYYDRWFYMQVKTIGLAGMSTPINTQTAAILDTGTNDLLLPEVQFIETSIKMCTGTNLSHCSDFFSKAMSGGTGCYNMTDAEVDAYPTLSFNLENNVTLTMTARDYLLQGNPVAQGPNEYCFGISNGGQLFIFGDSIMQNYYLVFAPHKIGWGPVNKETCGSK